MNRQTTDIRSLAIALLVPSATTAQAQRRKSFDKAKLDELASSIKSSGMVNPILVRPVGPYEIHSMPVGNGQSWFVWRADSEKKGDRVSDLFDTRAQAEAAKSALLRDAKQFEIVAGERRFQAAKLAELTEVPVSVRELSDDQVLELQLIENLQREGLHELHEAEGYESLRKRGMSTDEIAAKVGKSKEYVYARMKLLALGKEARDAFYDGTINASVALLIARIPVEKLQKQALKEITQGRGYGGPMSYRDAVEHVQETYMLRLDQAPFDITNTTLLTSAKACGACPKNTLSQPGLFGDVKAGADGICTDPVCHQAKTKAHAALVIAKAKADGKKVLEGGAAKKALDYHGERPAHDSGFVLPSEKNYQDSKDRTWRQLAGKDAPSVLIVHPDSGKVIEVLARSDVAAGMKKQGIKLKTEPSRSPAKTPQQAAADKKAAEKEAAEKEAADRALRTEVAKQLFERASKPLHRDELELIADFMFENSYGGDIEEEVFGDVAKINLKKASEPQLLKAIRAYAFLDVIQDTYTKPDALYAAAKRAGINVEMVRKELAAAASKEPHGAQTKKAKKS